MFEGFSASRLDREMVFLLWLEARHFQIYLFSEIQFSGNRIPSILLGQKNTGPKLDFEPAKSWLINLRRL
ncbi:hypothetical protein P872_06680 [Rhodonellum psychrophilum GCM71 = DSM 17998]|uniref:Uncharacterized protein n=1 Tax=Rhodonellum psychrophilum GCM71 = DSM 17998 TaxID=1123057 RepID=U5BXU2_9BACT|nr:hypothetical protein P872_06680 [Rhodonellum psychrophilum GCM71 = DSM 17998]